MDKSWFVLSLDTLGPWIEIISSTSYTMPTVPAPFSVRSSEKLGLWQDVYFADADGNRFNVPVSFSNDGFTAVGSVVADAASGIGILHIQLADEVDNKSNVIKCAINVIGTKEHICEITAIDQMYKVILSDIKRYRPLFSIVNLAKIEIAASAKEV